MAKRITIVDVAKAVDLSVSTVSKALMDATDIPEKTKELIREKVEELGYVPNMSASSLKNGNSKIIAILCDSLINPYYHIVIYHLEILLSKKNYTISIYRSNNFDTNIFKKIISRNPEGIISFLVPEKNVEAKLKSQLIPTVICGRNSETLSSVYSNNEKAGRLAADYLIEQNCKKVLYIGETEELPISKLRCKGFVDQLKKMKIEYKSYFKEEGVPLISLLNNLKISELMSCDGIYCFNDIMAFEIKKYLTEMDRKDVVVVGMDYIQSDIPLPFSMTSIGIDKMELASKTVNILMKNFEDPSFVHQLCIDDVRVYCSKSIIKK